MSRQEKQRVINRLQRIKTKAKSPGEIQNDQNPEKDMQANSSKLFTHDRKIIKVFNYDVN